jgi:hypothetical protein
MKVRKNKHRTMARLHENNQYKWFVTTALKGSEERRIVRERIKARIDKAFPELKGIPCPTWI